MRKLNKTGIRNIQQSGGSYYITLPIEIVRSFRWKERQKVVVKKIRGGIQVKDWKK
ncbi:MAG: hypothetical protein UX31_C0002G0026 [Candidatus Nomurabacteria bacterium GW2011_GWA1_46_11]|uniref:SpoVT-AbrB domain-containing protein n=1 Tax=Candidatus Nomurabacteria bacterium GW2011_GWA1_46_11 TaxID=1618732 RepID=A0A0G1QXA7_9BACT|nr:MAG: hypothetical protein UX31_C0002G0026 [Candidatus Nomurabacteria bacterium GW2011_GWA1_46_11]